MNNFFVHFYALLLNETTGIGFGGDEAREDEGIDEEGPLLHAEFGNVFWSFPFTEDVREFLFRGICCLYAMVERHDFACEAGFCVAWGRAILRRAQDDTDFIHRYIRAALEVGFHEVILDGHDFAEHLTRGIFEIDAVLVGLAHFAAVGSFKELRREDELFTLPENLLEMATAEHVEFLIRAPQFAVDVEHDRVVADEEWVDELREMDGFPLLFATSEHLPLFHLLLREVACELHHEFWR